MADASLYLFDGYNVFHSGRFRDVRELKNALASFVALRGARGIVVFDGVGEDEQLGALTVRYADHADAVLERLAVEHRTAERVCLISSDVALRGTTGQQVSKVSSREFVEELDDARPGAHARSPLADRLDAATRERLERWRRGG